MRTAPPVQVCGCGGWPWRAVRVGLPTLAFGLLAMVLSQHVAVALRTSRDALWFEPLAVAMMVGCAVAAVQVWRSQALPCLQLQWDGGRWLLNGQAGHVAVALDLKAWLLLRWAPLAGGAVVWVPLLGTELGQAESALRAALYCPAPRTGVPAKSSAPAPGSSEGLHNKQQP